MSKYIVGVDEVGRGPIAGPVAVCAFAIKQGDEKATKLLTGIRDSKKLSEKKREEWFEKFKEAKEEKLIDYKVAFVSPAQIDKLGVAPSIKAATAGALKKICSEPKKCKILLDGGIKAPEVYENQESIIGGDDTEPAISAASVVAKVTRDRQMKKYAKKFPEYGFEKHKGYGTMAHYEALGKHGLTKIHRKSFLRKIID